MPSRCTACKAETIHINDVLCRKCRERVLAKKLAAAGKSLRKDDPRRDALLQKLQAQLRHQKKQAVARLRHNKPVGGESTSASIKPIPPHQTAAATSQAVPRKPDSRREGDESWLVCPKCQKRQPASDSCLECGIIFSRYAMEQTGAPAAPPEEAGLDQTQARRAEPEAIETIDTSAFTLPLDMNLIQYLGLCLFLLIAGVVFLATHVKQFSQALGSSGWPTATATIRSASVGDDDSQAESSQTKPAMVVYEYQYGSTKYSSERISFRAGPDKQKLRRLLGDKAATKTVTVFVDPQEPSLAVIFPGVPLLLWLKLLSAIAIIVAGGVCIAVCWVRSQWLLRHLETFIRMFGIGVCGTLALIYWVEHHQLPTSNKNFIAIIFLIFAAMQILFYPSGITDTADSYTTTRK